MLALVIAIPSQAHSQTGTERLSLHHAPTPQRITERIFGPRSRVAWCIAYYESRHQLRARNGANLGPWQVNVDAHPWADPWRLTHSWWYAARVAYRISAHGTDWYTAWIKFVPREAACL